MTPSLGAIAIDLPRLLETRMLIQANSGAGKSHALRRVLEQTAPLVQQLVVDPEGEFQTLRERFDYIVCAPSGADAVATPKTAAALALALWRSGSSAILDIYELQKHERVLFVRRFLEALTAAPKSAWHSTIVALDEIQDYCPEGAQAESAGAVIDCAARGRKRGLCLVGATQRIARVSKDAAAELLNKAIGRTGQDVDVRRAAAELGMSNYRDALETLRNLEPGEFFVFGPALSKSVERTRFGPVITTHPEIGQKALAAPPPASAKVKGQLAKLEGLQLEEAEKAKTVETLSAEVANLRRKLTIAEKATASGGIPEAEVQRRIREALAVVPQAVPVAESKLTKALEQIAQLASSALAGRASPPGMKVASSGGTRNSTPVVAAAKPGPISDGLKAPEQRIVDAIAWWAAAGVEAPSRHQVAFVAGYTVNGHFNNQAGTLRGRGVIDYPGGGALSLTPTGGALANKPAAQPTRDDLVQRVVAVLRGEPMRRVFLALVSNGRPMTRAQLAEVSGYTVNGHFNNIVGALNGIGVVEYPGNGMVALPALFGEVAR